MNLNLNEVHFKKNFYNPATVDTGYMVIGYKVKSDIRSILGWYGFPYTKNYWIYGQISDIWSEILIKLKTKAIESGVF